MARGFLVLLCALFLSCSGKMKDPSREFGPAVPSDAPLHPVTIHQPETVGVLDTNVHDINGSPVGISCVTCHKSGTHKAFATQDVPEDFHSGMKMKHGNISCNSCHDSKDRTKLHLADGKKLDFDQAMMLCAQCHGVQYRDYLHGSHGGMNGYWDLKRGPRDRNSCLDCHSAHTPAYQKVMPVHPPKDRFLEWKKNHEEKGMGDQHE